MNCPFCEINNDKNRIIKESKYSFVMLSNPRLMPGHLLVIPKRHIEKLSDLKEVERKDLWNLVIEFEEKILKYVSKGCDIRQNYRPFQKQSDLKVNHLHVHLQPREFEDQLYKKSQIHETELFKKLSKKEIDKILEKINREMNFE